MSFEGQRIVPGEDATPAQILALANEFRRSAEGLFSADRRRKGLAWSPFRFLSIHAIELYLSAYLKTHGHSSSTLRSLGHDLSRRRIMANNAGLILAAKTAKHLDAVSKSRDYLITRYGPEMNGDPSPPNRFKASLDEIAKKVTKHFATKN